MMNKLNLHNPKRQAIMILAFQSVLIALMYPFLNYEPEATPGVPRNPSAFQDVHVMIFVGFGFLMTFMKRYGQSSLGLTFLIAGFFIQVALLAEVFVTMDSKNRANLSLDALVDADTAVAAILISFGAIIGKTSFFQLIILGLIEIAAYTYNRHICLRYLQILDSGGSIFVHMFGAYFGLAASYTYNNRKKIKENKLLEASYESDIFAMLGTLFLWLYWPSFNSAGLTDDSKIRAVVNTVLAISTSCIASFVFSIFVTESQKFNMTHVQNASLTGGVAIGTVAGLICGPFAAATAGLLAGAISVYGYHYVTPYLERKFKIHDTCGVHNVHGLPSFISALYGAVLSYFANLDDYHNTLYELFPARTPMEKKALDRIKTDYRLELMPGKDRTALAQAGYQLLAIPVTLLFAIGAGAVAGYCMKMPVFGNISDFEQFEDSVIFDMLPENIPPKVDLEIVDEPRRNPKSSQSRSSSDINEPNTNSQNFSMEHYSVRM